MRQGGGWLVKDPEFWAVGLDLVVEEPGSHHRRLLLYFHIKYWAKGTVPEHLSRAGGQCLSSRCYSGIYEYILPALLARRQQREGGKIQGEN